VTTRERPKGNTGNESTNERKSTNAVKLDLLQRKKSEGLSPPSQLMKEEGWSKEPGGERVVHLNKKNIGPEGSGPSEGSMIPLHWRQLTVSNAGR